MNFLKAVVIVFSVPFMVVGGILGFIFTMGLVGFLGVSLWLADLF